MVFGVLFSIICCLLWLFALVDAITSNLSGINKLLWVLIILIIPCLGALLWIFLGRTSNGS